MTVYLNGRLVADDEARIDPTDRGLTLGDGLFETIAVRGRRAARTDAHLARLGDGAEVIRLAIPLAGDELKAALQDVIEANAIDIVQPAAAEMIQIALTLQAKTKVDFASGIRLDNGQVQLTYQEKIEGSAGTKGELKIPEKFTLALRIFQGGDKYQVEAYLRYRIKEGKATFFYQIIRPERLIEDAFEQVKKQVETGCTGGAIFATA